MDRRVEDYALIGNMRTAANAGRWRALVDRIHAHVCDNGFDKERNAFLQRRFQVK
ncbi:MAG TPA: hypothetical protein VFP92_06070 [Rhodanobacteraceae bacterium]|nr:hypothetical protein [Rhodanobacteraceae bacterium]